MAKYAPDAIKGAWPIVDKAFRSVKFSGILEGSAAGNGYHHSREDLLRRGKTKAYSIQHPLDKKGNPEAASAIDFTFDNVEELATATSRMLKAARKKDPRLFMKCREFGGTLNGKTVTAYNITEQRYISMDKSHLWHLHVSGHRAYADDHDVWRGIADVIAGIPLNDVAPTPGAGGGGSGNVPPKWNGKSFPGRNAFRLGHRHDAVTLLGKRLIAHGYGQYKVGPGPNFTEVDLASTKAFQEAQGWTGSDADGYPGPETWKRLMAEPKPKPAPKPKPIVDLSKVIAAAERDTDRPQGGTTSGAADDVRIVEAALKAEGLLSSKYAGDGSFGSVTVDAYAAWQRKLGYRGRDADGIPGKASLQKLGAKHGFTVKD